MTQSGVDHALIVASVSRGRRAATFALSLSLLTAGDHRSEMIISGGVACRSQAPPSECFSEPT